MNCIYCGKKAKGCDKTNEHVVPQWVQEFLEARKAPMLITPINRYKEKLKERSATANTLTHKICEDCNGGWLNEIDTSCQEWLKFFMVCPILKESYTDHNIEEFRSKLYTFVYKIFLNYMATGPFKKDKLVFYRHFYMTRQVPQDVFLFASNVCLPQPVFLTHMDIWRANFAGKSGSESGLRFKFFMQFGLLGLVSCCLGSEEAQLVYDPTLTSPLVGPAGITETIHLEPPPEEIHDNIAHRVLWSMKMRAS